MSNEKGDGDEAEAEEKAEAEAEEKPQPEQKAEAEHKAEPTEAEAVDPKSKLAPEAPEKTQPTASRDAPKPGGWAGPFVVVDRWWTWFEERLLVAVILGLMFVMGAWVVMRGMQEPVAAAGKAGVVLRAMLGMVIFGPLTWVVAGLFKLKPVARQGAVGASLALAAILAPAWRDTGVEYFGHMFNWLQEGSSLTMFGQLRGVSTRLTVLLAMVGASLAAAGGKHINIDAFLRFVPKKLKLITFVASSIATAVVCFAAAWGFFENIAVNNFGAQREWTRSEKFDRVEQRVSQDLFLWRVQVGFDLEALPIVVGGGKWDDEKRMNGRQWNELVESSGYREHFSKEQVDAILAPPDGLEESRLPMVIVPDGSPRGLLVHTMNLTFPVGFIIVGLRFLLRLVLVLAGLDPLDPDVEFLDEKKEAEAKDDAKTAAAAASEKEAA